MGLIGAAVLIGVVVLAAMVNALTGPAVTRLPTTFATMLPTVAGTPPAGTVSAPTPTQTRTTTAPSPTTTPTATTSAVPPKQPTKAGPRPSGVGRPEPKPAPAPWPTSWSVASRWTKQNPLYRGRVAPTRCAIPLIDQERIKAAALERHLELVAGCLTMAWRPTVQVAGFQMPYPVVHVYAGAATGPCGRMDAYNAYYCSASQRIYFGLQLREILPAQDFAYDLILAHEYGHATQGRTGIFGSGLAYAQAAETPAKRSVVIRRMELQADCFAGLAMNSLAGSSGFTSADRSGFAVLIKAIADDTLTGRIGDHGSAKARARWLNRGLAGPQVSACSTFTAAAKLVR